MQYDKDRYNIWGLTHPIVAFWRVCPPVIINELILGHRQPKVLLVDKMSDKPWMERCYIPCPHCETLNDARLWSKWNAIGNWFGLVCPSCHQIIPCLWNIFSLTILAITYPLWYFPAKALRQRWFEKAKERLANAQQRPLRKAASINWFLIGIFFWGGSMYMIFDFFPQLWDVLHGKEWDLTLTLFMLLLYAITGFGFGLSMHWLMNRKGNK